MVEGFQSAHVRLDVMHPRLRIRVWRQRLQALERKAVFFHSVIDVPNGSFLNVPDFLVERVTFFDERFQFLF